MPGLPASQAGSRLAGRFGATQITHGFLPGAVLARALGRQDCLGATMCLRRQDLDRIGGFHALVDHLADDNVLGRRIAALGLRVALADTVPLTTVPEASLRALFRHELRWARTIRALEPAGFAASVLQYPLAWALLTIAAGRRRTLVRRPVPARLGCCGPSPPVPWTAPSGRYGPMAGQQRLSTPCILAARSGFCRCETSCRWP